MSKQKKGLEPALRFPEFQGQTSWMRFKLIDVADKNVKWSFIGGPFGSNLKASDYLKKGIRIIQLQNIGDGQFNDDYRVFTSKEKADELLANNIYPGDIIISKMGDPVGRACIIPETNNRYVMCSDGIRLVVDEERHSKYFIYSIINYSQFRKIIEISATGSTRKRIGLAELKKLPMFLPVKKEQQKIADCLRSIDELIIANTNKCESFKLHKQGLMQKLFPTEGRDVPELRFDGFEGEWKEVELRKLGNLISGLTYSPDDVRASGLLVLRSSNVQNGKIVYEDNVFVEPNIKGANISEPDDILICVRNGSKALIGKNALIPQNVPLSTHGAFMTIFRSKYAQFIFQLFQTDAYQKQVDADLGATINSINGKQLLKYKFKIPRSNDEKEMIVKCLSSLDDLINAQTDKIEVLKEYKKGLMQQLFPDIKESIA
ncbi:restriction endonuclease subunit S [Vibrio cholerae]|uniref:restriction endonuclease subunit S n=1 Tax=Vibrio cholerae TaxID=666 RepID=UPI0035315781